MGRLPRVGVLATGGTIDAIGYNRLDVIDYTETGNLVGLKGLLSRIPEVDSIAEIVELPFPSVWSSTVTPAIWADLAKLIQSEMDRLELNGVVVTHGTATLEETAFFLHLTVNTHCPIVVTGAMRPTSAIGTDADLNLLTSIRVAATSEFQDLGVVIVLNERIHSARYVTKVHTTNLDAFESIGGLVGEAYADGTISIARRVTHPHTSSSMFRSCLSRPQPRVDIVLSYPGSDGTFIDAAVAAGARGIVAAGFGSGQCTPGENDALVRAEAKGITVVQATRVLGGAVPLAAVMRRRHFISSVDLQPPKARILLMLALALTDDAREIQQMFKEY